VKLRDEAASAAGTASPVAESGPDADARPAEFFAGIPLEHLDPKERKVPPPPAPAAK